MRGKTLVGLLMPLFLIGAACSDGNAAPATTTSAIVAAPPSTSPASTQPTTTQPTTTTAPTTTAPTTTAPTVPPTTAPPTVVPGSVEEQVVAAAVESWRLLNEARLDPFNDEKVRMAGQAHTGSARSSVVETIAEYRLNNQRSVTNTADPARVIPYPGTVVVDTVAGTASVQYCQVDTNIVVAIAANPDGTDQVLDDGMSAYRLRIDLTLVDGRWLESGGELLQTWEGVSVCPDQS